MSLLKFQKSISGSYLYTRLRPEILKWKRNMCTTKDNNNGSGSNVIVEDISNITLIAINRPEKRNCVNPETARELIAAFEAFEENPNSPVAILYGKGGTFCAGYDLEYLASQKEETEFDPYFFNPDCTDGVGPMGPSRRFFKKPVIAAVAGYAVAGGLELALMCDFRVVEDTAILGVFCRRFGVPLLDGGSVRLPHLIGLSRAMDMLLTGRPVHGKEAVEIGLANRITSTGTVVGKAIQIANGIARYPQECLNKDRMSAYNSVFSASSLEDALTFEMKNGLDVIHKESIAGAMRFMKGVGKHGSFRYSATQDSAEES